MISNTNTLSLRSAVVVTGTAMLIWSLVSFSERLVLLRSISTMTILAFFLLIGQFFNSRMGSKNGGASTMRRSFRFHDMIGYTCISVLLFHPFYLVIPKFIEKGLAPGEAFLTILTTFTSRGVILGMISWELMLLLGLTSFFRKKLPMKYTTWRTTHSILAILFLITAGCHVIDLGRHANFAMSIFIILLTGSAVYVQLKRYISHADRRIGETK